VACPRSPLLLGLGLALGSAACDDTSPLDEPGIDASTLGACPSDAGFDAGVSMSVSFIHNSFGVAGRYEPLPVVEGIGPNVGCGGGCVVREVYPTDAGVRDGGPPVPTGTISVSWVDGGVVIPPPHHRGSTTATLIGGEVLTLTAAGDASGYAPWSATITAPPGVVLQLWAPGAVHSRGQPLALAWTLPSGAVAAGVLEFTFTEVGAGTPYHQAFCTFPIANLSAVVPAGVLGALQAGNVGVGVTARGGPEWLTVPPLELSVLHFPAPVPPLTLE
jgi:hypothetical protein